MDYGYTMATPAMSIPLAVVYARLVESFSRFLIFTFRVDTFLN